MNLKGDKQERIPKNTNWIVLKSNYKNYFTTLYRRIKMLYTIGHLAFHSLKKSNVIAYHPFLNIFIAVAGYKFV